MAWQLISFYCLIIFHCMNECNPCSPIQPLRTFWWLPSLVLPNKAAVTVPVQVLCGHECSAPLETPRCSCCFLLHPVTDAPAPTGDGRAPACWGRWGTCVAALSADAQGCVSFPALASLLVSVQISCQVRLCCWNPRAELWSSLHREDKHAVRRVSGQCPPPACGLSSCCLSSVFCRVEVFHFNQVQRTSFFFHRARFWPSI